MARLTFAALTIIGFALCAGGAIAQDQEQDKQDQIPSVSARLVCSCRCLAVQREVHDLELPENSQCKIYNNLDCRLTSGLPGRYADCEATGVPVAQ